LNYCKTIYPLNRNIEKTLLPYEIKRISEEKIKQIEIVDEKLVSETFLKDIRAFFE
jgi:hypothetical protein